MKTLLSLSVAFATVACLTTSTMAAESKHNAEYFLSTPMEFENKDISLDVAFVKPVHWKSPIPELAFFHAITIDKRDKKPGGGILIVIPAEDAGKFVKKYGTDFDGRSDSDSLKGVFVATPARGPKGRVWFVDTTGQALTLLEKYKAEIMDDGDMGGPGGGPGPGGRRGGPGRPGPGGPQ